MEQQRSKETIAVIGGITGDFGQYLIEKLDVSGKMTKAISGRIENKEINSVQIIIVAIPSDAIDTTLDFIQENPNSQIILTSKGILSQKLYTHLTEEEKQRVFIISGPNIASQIDAPTATVLAGINEEETEKLQKRLNGQGLRVYASSSPEVIQLSGIVKNLIVFELGMVWDKLNKSEKSVLLGKALDAGYSVIKSACPENENPEEYWGIAGMGDILLCLEFFKDSAGSRNFREGRNLANGKSSQEKTVEGESMHHDWHDEKLPQDFETEEMQDLRKILNNITNNTQENLSTKTNDLDFLKKVFASIWNVFEGVSEIKTELHQSNTQAWLFSRCYKELIAIYGEQYEKSVIQQAMIECILCPNENQEYLENSDGFNEFNEEQPILSLLKDILANNLENGELSTQVTGIFMNRETISEGF